MLYNIKLKINLKAVLSEVSRNYIEFRENFTKETFSYDERLKNEELKDESHEGSSNSETAMLGTF